MVSKKLIVTIVTAICVTVAFILTNGQEGGLTALWYGGFIAALGSSYSIGQGIADTGKAKAKIDNKFYRDGGRK